jgi:hypothetical protein
MADGQANKRQGWADTQVSYTPEPPRSWFQRHRFLLVFILILLGSLIALWIRNPVSSVFIVHNEGLSDLCGVSIYPGDGRPNPPLVAHKGKLPNGISGILVYAGDEPPATEPIAKFKVKGRTVLVYYPGEREPDIELDTSTRSITNDHVELSIRGDQILEDKPYSQKLGLPYGGTLDIEYPEVESSANERVAHQDRSKSNLDAIFFLKPGIYVSRFEGCWIATGGGDYAQTYTTDPYEFEVKFGQIVGLTIEDEPEE